MSKVSVIIPVYNAEKTLSTCLYSLNNQTYKDFSVIAVNDGSTDKSLETLGRLQAQLGIDITIYDKANGGAASARKYALDRADSKYITFVDSDDYVDKRYLEEMHDTIEETKTNICSARFAIHFNNPILRHIPFKCRKREKTVDLVKDKKFLALLNVVTTAKLYRREYVDITKRDFKANEDLSYNYFLYAQARHISFANDVKYHYVPNSTGLVSTRISGYTWDKMKNTFLPLSNLKRIFEDYELLDIYYSEIEQIFINNIFQRVDYISNAISNEEDRINLINTLFDFLTFHFPNWRENKYLKEDFKGFEIPFIMSAKANKKRILTYTSTIYGSEEEVIKQYKNISERIRS